MIVVIKYKKKKVEHIYYPVTVRFAVTIWQATSLYT